MNTKSISVSGVAMGILAVVAGLLVLIWPELVPMDYWYFPHCMGYTGYYKQKVESIMLWTLITN